MPPVKVIGNFTVYSLRRGVPFTDTQILGVRLKIKRLEKGKHSSSLRLIALLVAPVSISVWVKTPLILISATHLYFFPGKLWLAVSA